MSGEKRGRTRPSGLGSKSRKFATVRMPDGREARVPAAKDAATHICLELPGGGWPDKSLVVLLYDVTHLVEGSIFALKEMRPGHGMGERRMLRVVNSRVEVELHEGNYGQVQRWLLCEQLESVEERMAMTPDELEAGVS